MRIKLDKIKYNSGSIVLPISLFENSGGVDLSLLLQLVTLLLNDVNQLKRLAVIALFPIPETWPTTSLYSMDDLIAAINADDTAVPGRIYLSTVSLNDLPYYVTDNTEVKLSLAEMRVEIMVLESLGPDIGIKKVILFTVTSTNYPYHWEYTSAWGNTASWVSFEVR